MVLSLELDNELEESTADGSEESTLIQDSATTQTISKYFRVLKSFPPGIMGMSLGLCGGASIYLEFSNFQKEGYIRTISLLCYQFHNGAATTLLLLFIFRMLADFQNVRKEIYKVDVIPPYASGQMAFLFITGRVLFYLLGLTGAQGFVYVFAFVQLALMLGFFYRCYQTSTYPEPFWNPPTVNCSVTTIVGAILNMPQWITVGSFLLGLFLQLTIVPPQVYRTVSNVKVSPSIATNMMQAPCSLNMITWGVMRRYKLHLPQQLGLLFGFSGDGIHSNEFEDGLTHVLHFFSVLVVWLTVYALYARRESIIRAGFHPGWAVLTFPTCSSAVATLQYAGITSHDLATPKLTYMSNAWQWALKVYGICFSLITCCIVLSVFVGYVVNFGFATSVSKVESKPLVVGRVPLNVTRQSERSTDLTATSEVKSNNDSVTSRNTQMEIMI